MFPLKLSLCLLVSLAASLPCSAAVRIVQIEPTALFSSESAPRQVGWLSLENTATTPLQLEAIVALNGQVTTAPQRLTVEPGLSRHDLLIPDTETEAEMQIRLRHEGRAIPGMSLRWKPQRKWKVFVVKSSHEDIGYENFLFVKQKEIADFIDLGKHLSGPPDLPPDSPRQAPPSYHYFMETLLFPRYYMEERSEPAWRQLVNEKVLTGSMGLGGAPSGVHTHWMDYEELVRTTYPARREYRDRFGLDLDTYAIVDNPSISWPTVQVLARAGFKYAVRFGAPFRAGGNNDYATTKLPAIFWWRAPDRQSRVLFTWRSRYSDNFWFGEAVSSYSPLLDLAAINVNREVMAVQSGEKLGPYPWDALLVATYRDHTTPAWDNTAFRNWRTKYRYPEIRIASPRDFLVYMEEKYRAELPELSGDLNNFSADYSTIDPEGQEWKRRAARLLPLAEGLQAAARSLNPAVPPQAPAVATAFQRIFDFTEHSWPTTPVPGEFHQFNAQWGKHLEGRRAVDNAEAILAGSMRAFTAQIATGEEPLLVVINPLAHPRSDPVLVDRPLAFVVDSASGRRLPVQPLPDGKSVFFAQDVPAFGFRGYRMVERADPVSPAADLQAGPDYIANRRYRLRFDPTTGAITSIHDKELEREWIDSTAPYRFNQLVYVEKKGRETIAGTNYSPAGGARLKTSVGPVLVEMRASLSDALLGDARIVQTVRLYSDSSRIDIVNELSNFGILHSGYTDRYRKNVFYAFPIAVESFVPRAEYAGAVLRPFDDQLRWGSHDFLHANRWVDVSNAAHGFTMAPGNAATVHFGEIRYNQLSNRYRPTSPHLYSFAWSNRMAGLKELAPSDWNATLRYSFAAHRGDWNGGDATKLGWSVASPLLAHVLPARQNGPLPFQGVSILSLDQANVQLVVLKEAEQPGRGWIVRLIETHGQDTEVTLRAPGLSFDAATQCDLVENDLSPLVVNHRQTRLKIGAHAYATLRLYTKESAPLPVQRIAAKAISDTKVHLSWTPTARSAAYHIHRSSDPAAPATSHTWVGRTTAPEYVDAGLSIGTEYHYIVVPVTAGNTPGDPAPPAIVRTLWQNTTAPAVVKELGVVRLSPTTLMICWRKSAEPDVSRYLVYRGDSPDFSITGQTPVGEVAAGPYQFVQYFDHGLTPGRLYYYQVLAEDWAGHRQTHSPVASSSTPEIAAPPAAGQTR